MGRLAGVLAGGAALGFAVAALLLRGGESESRPPAPNSRAASPERITENRWVEPESASPPSRKSAQAAGRSLPPQDSSRIVFPEPSKPRPDNPAGFVPSEATLAQSGPLPADDTPVFEVEPGVLVPVALAPSASSVGLSPRQENLKNGIANKFLDEMQNAPAEDPEVLSRQWSDKQEEADISYRKLFGDIAYQRQSLDNAKAGLRP